MPTLKNTYEQHLIDCLSVQCTKTKAHIDEYRNFFANNRHSSGFTDVWKQLTFALSVHRSEGAYVYDLDNNPYLDITMGFGVHLFGHSPQFIKEAILLQLEKGISLGPLFYRAAETAKLICEMTKNDRCAFFNSGTEAVMVSLRLARAATGKTKTVIFEGSYHGTHDSLLVMKSQPFTHIAIANVPGISQSLAQDTILLPFGEEKSIAFIEAHAAEIAAVITEPVRSRHPEEINPFFLQQLEQVCAAKRIVFILDEVITGFRVANGGAKELFGLHPDLVIYGKVVGGGLPIGVVAGKKTYLDFIDGGSWNFSDDSKPVSATTFVAGTFCHHPLAMATTKATLDFLLASGNRVQQEVNHHTSALCNRINEFCCNHSIPIQTAHFGSLFRFLIKGRNRIFYHALLKENIYLWEGRNCFLSTAHDTAAINSLHHKIEKCLIEMKAAGYFPASGSKKTTLTDAFYLQASIEINELLDKTRLELAFHYTVEQLNASNKTNYSRAFIFSEISDTMNIGLAEQAGAIRCFVFQQNNKTQLVLQALKNSFDGWSLIVLFRYISKCFQALEMNKNLPLPSFIGNHTMGNLLNSESKNFDSHKPSPACSIHQFIPTGETKHSFEQLLTCFAIALGEDDLIIGVPVSGALVSRKLAAVGPYTCHVPIRLTAATQSEWHQLTDSIRFQLKKSKKNFYYWYNKKEKYSIIFNVDNLMHDFQFAGRKAALVQLDDLYTNHELVCTILAEPAGLHITLKYKSESSIKAKQLLERFCSLISHYHVSSPSK